MVINIGALKSKKYNHVSDDIEKVKKICAQNATILKVILETALLTEEEKIICSQICRDLKVDFVKTSTGFSTSGAKIEDIKLIKNIVGDVCQIKASGGIKTYEQAIEMIKAGATRIGTSSISIINEAP